MQVRPGTRAAEAARSLRPSVVIIKEASGPARVVADMRAAAPRAAIIAFVVDVVEEEASAVIRAGAQFYGATGDDLDQRAIIDAALRAVRRPTPAPTETASRSIH